MKSLLISFLFVISHVSSKRKDGGWSNWSDISDCFTSDCNNPFTFGYQYRIRACVNPRPSGGGFMCQGEHITAQMCFEPVNCPVDGGWSEWGEWKCLDSFMTRKRTCTNPTPKNGGKICNEKFSREIVQSDEDEEEFKKICLKKLTDDEDFMGSGSGSGSGEGSGLES
ncbi:netrin receptor UNC5C-like [Centruroides sculpturatus]|uniref:netrin receptor UNC5C-like n=1 Tax=Centruroides sculpturatus TaxID=218467 RepID=UPI000C6E2323|nr:netrin receptor UNC5C-like [Centruroides sculpturatus]